MGFFATFWMLAERPARRTTSATIPRVVAASARAGHRDARDRVRHGVGLSAADRPYRGAVHRGSEAPRDAGGGPGCRAASVALQQSHRRHLLPCAGAARGRGGRYHRPGDHSRCDLERGGAVAGYLWNNGGVFSGDFGYYVAGRGRVGADRVAVRVHHVPDRALRCCAGGAARARTALHRAAAVRHHAPLLRGLGGAAGELRPHHASSRCWWRRCCCRWSSLTRSRPRPVVRPSSRWMLWTWCWWRCWCSC